METNFPEYSGRPENEENSNSNFEKFSCKLPILLDIKQRKTKPHYLSSDLALFEFIVKNLRNQRRTHSINEMDDFTPEDPSKRLILDSLESFLKARNLPKNPQKLSKLKSMQMSSTLDNSCGNNSLNTGLLHRVFNNGLPNFEFSIDDPNNIYVANPVKIKSLENTNMDLVYLFNEGGNAKKDSSSQFLGKMRVSNKNILNPDGSTCKETEFVLYGSKDEYLREMQNPSLSFVKNKGLINKFAGMLKPTFSPLPRYAHKSSKSLFSQAQIDTDFCETGTNEGEISGTKEPVPNIIISDDFSTSLELATIIIKDDDNKNKPKNYSESVIGGWGLKFLKKCETKSKNNSREGVNVLVPKGFHGGPIGTSVGTSSLRERWTNGICTCGGWDLGCPIRVLNNGLDDPLHEKSQENGSHNLFLEGARNKEPVLKIVNVSENLYLIYFGSNISPLQCFSIAVAMIHAQTPELLS